MQNVLSPTQCCVFLIDTSASMNQRTHLDFQEGTLRGRDPVSRGEPVHLEDVPLGIKTGWKESHATFTTETAFDLLNLSRLVSGIKQL
uniref:VWFA domain-containing protein n=1 Tax=Salmo trutta TaxID=8032 RepID=A0A673WFM7_SALTR